MIRGNNGVYNSANSSSWSTTSDRRVKKNIVDNTIGLDVINQIKVRNFDYKTKDEILEDSPEFTKWIDSVVKDVPGTQIGVIAQEIEDILPDVVLEMTESKVKSVNPDNLTWYLINAVKELSAEIEKLKAA